MERRTRTQNGFTIIEALVASMIVGVAIAGMLNLFAFAFNLDTRTDQMSVAYSIARRNLEAVRTQGFAYAPEGARVLYYNAEGGGESTTQGPSSAYKATVSVISDRFAINPITHEIQPADTALRTVTSVVVRLSDNAEVDRQGTYLVRSGI